MTFLLCFREIKALQQIEDNPYAARLREVFPHGSMIVLVFDYMLSDLSEVIRKSERPLTEAQVKSYMLMLFKGLAFLHENNIMHRVGGVLKRTITLEICSNDLTISFNLMCCVVTKQKLSTSKL